MLAKKLSKYESNEKNLELSHTSFDGKKYYVCDDELQTFYEIYLKYNKKNSIVERHIMLYSPVVIDFDIKQSTKKRLIDDEIIDNIYNLFVDEFKKIFVNNPNYLCYFLMRPAPYKYRDCYKDGIHIYFPNIVTTFEFQFKFREHMMPFVEDKLKNINNLNTISDTYDKSVIKSNGMFLLGSTKPNIKPYEIYKIYNNNDQTLTPIETLNILSLRNKCAALTEYINDDIKNEYIIVPNNKTKTNVEHVCHHNICSGNSNDEPLDKLEYLVMLLPEPYYDEYKKWFDIGIILYNSNKNSFDVFDKFSKQSPKYTYDETFNVWNKLNNKTYDLTLGSLIYFLKQENISYDKYKNNTDKDDDDNVCHKYDEDEFEQLLKLLPNDNQEMKYKLCVYVNTNFKKLKNILKKWYNNDILFNEHWNKSKSEKIIINVLKKYMIEYNKLDEYKEIHNKYINKRMDEEQKLNINNCIMDHKQHFDDKSNMEIDKVQNIADRSIVALLKDKYCPIKKCNHDEAYTRLVIIPKTMEMYQECSKCNDYHPQNLIRIDDKYTNVFNVNYGTINNITNITNVNVIPKEGTKLIETDKDAADIVLKHIEKKIIKSNRRYFIKENENIYIEDISPFYDDTKNFLLKEISNLNLCKYLENSNKLKPYSKNTSGAMNIMKLVLVHLNDDKEFVKQLWKSNLEKLCFKNGYYDFKERRFKEYDDETFSPIYIKKVFPERNEEKIKEVYDKILDPIFWDKDQQAYFLNWCARGLAGIPTKEKTWSCSIGLRNCGKGVLYELFKTTFEDYVLSFNPEEMICCRVGCGDIAKKMAWTIPFEFSRLNFSNELKTEDDKGRKLKLDGNIIKSISSGGDEKTARLNYKNEIRFKIQGRMMLMMNELIGVTPYDATETMELFRFKSVFKDEITDDDEEINKSGQFKFIKANPYIKNIINDDIELQNAFIHIIIDHYSEIKYILPNSMKDEKDDINDHEDSVENKLKSIFEFTKNRNDRLSISIVNEKTREIGIPKSALKTTLPKLGVVEVKDNMRFYSKIKLKQIEFIDYE